MFQNIAKVIDDEEESFEDVELNKKTVIKELLKKWFSIKMIILYMISFLLSFVGFGVNSDFAPFGIAFLVAILSSCNPIGIVGVFVLIGTAISFGGSVTLNTLFTLLLVFVSILIKSPRYNEDGNEKRRLGIRLFICTLLVQVVRLFFKEVLVYDIICSLVYSIAVYIFYKIFVNAIPVIENITEKRAYSIEEVLSTALLIAIAFCAVRNLNILGYSITNILCILVVLIMGWKNGILTGATAGVTIGSVVGIICGAEPILIATYALSGMVAGIFNRLGKIGVIVGFILGNVILSFVANGNTASIIPIQEILFASIGLLFIPKSMKIDIEDLYGKTKLLTEGPARTLEDNKETIYKLNSMSDSLSAMAKTYKEAAATIVDEEELRKQEEDNFSIFERELLNDLQGIEDNFLYDDIYESEDEFLKDIFFILLEKEKIDRRDLIDTLEKHNSYIIGGDKEYINDQIEGDIAQVIKIINYSYKVSKLNFIWKKKLDENKKNVSTQLEEVSKAIGALAEEIDEKKENLFSKEKEEIKELLEERDIYIEDINIKTEESGRKIVTLFTKTCQDVENPTCDVKKMAKILSKVLEEDMILQKQECGLRMKKASCLYKFISKDKFLLDIGIATETKESSTVSGDTNLQTKLDDGKYLLAISDGMGSGIDARKASKTTISLLEKLLSSGFNKDSSLRLINSTLNTIDSEKETFATLDMAVIDLYSNKLEFIKNAACPTYIKNDRNIEILKSLSLPNGILNDIDLVVYDRELKVGDTIIMCSDGIFDSSNEYTNKELWLKFLLEDLETNDAQKIADIILKEAVDNNYGKPKDDMTVIVAKVKKSK